jgi:hypothetical protein
MKTSNLAYRIPMLVACAAVLGGCYTMLRHPVTDVTEEGEHDSAAYGTDCGSCHAGGFDEALLPNPYPYVAGPFIGFYDNPWWYENRPGWTTGGSVGSGTGTGSPGSTTTADDDVRIIGSRGPATLPNVYRPPSGVSSPPPGATSPTPAATPPPSGSSTPSKPSTGQQPGRTMKETLDSKEPAPTKKKEQDKPKDGSGG